MAHLGGIHFFRGVIETIDDLKYDEAYIDTALYIKDLNISRFIASDLKKFGNQLIGTSDKLKKLFGSETYNLVKDGNLYVFNEEQLENISNFCKEINETK